MIPQLCNERGWQRKLFVGPRPALPMERVCALADLMPARQRMLLVVATFASLRYGEVTALRRMDIDLALGTVSVRQAFSEVRGRGMVLGPRSPERAQA